jgi:hypothetical protein
MRSPGLEARYPHVEQPEWLDPSARPFKDTKIINEARMKETSEERDDVRRKE